MKKLMCLIGAVAAAGSLLAAEEISEVETKKAPGKMMLRIASVETPDTRSEKSWTPPRIPAAAKKLPWSGGHSEGESEGCLEDETRKFRPGRA